MAYDHACERCKAAEGVIGDPIQLGLDEVLPHHAGCDCAIKISKTSRNGIEIGDAEGNTTIPKKEEGAAAVEQPTESLEAATIVCPGCGKTAMLQKATGRFYCKVCNESHDPPKEKKSGK